MANVGSEDGTKDRIRRIAAELFAKNGYHATGVAELSSAVELGRGALYYHIGNKETLLFEISRVPVERLNAQTQEIVRSSQSPFDKFNALGDKLLENIVNHRAEWTVFFREFYALTGERKKKIMVARERYEGFWRTVIAEGVEDGVFKPVDHILLKGLLGMFNYSYLWFDPDGELTAVEVARKFTETLLNGIRCGVNATREAGTNCGNLALLH
jgi:AcrR family transcriptional regulator